LKVVINCFNFYYCRYKKEESKEEEEERLAKWEKYLAGEDSANKESISEKSDDHPTGEEENVNEEDEQNQAPDHVESAADSNGTSDDCDMDGEV
jgi:hypothetical protein